MSLTARLILIIYNYFGLSGIMVLFIGVIINGFNIVMQGNFPLKFPVYLYWICMWLLGCLRTRGYIFLRENTKNVHCFVSDTWLQRVIYFCSSSKSLNCRLNTCPFKYSNIAKSSGVRSGQYSGNAGHSLNLLHEGHTIDNIVCFETIY